MGVRLRAGRAGGLQWLTGYLGLALVFMWDSALREEFRGRFISGFRSFLLVLTKLSFWQGGWALGYHSVGFRHFPDVS